MVEGKKVIFGIDGSDFCEHALKKTGDLFKNSENLEITLFKGVPAPYYPSSVHSDRHFLELMEKYEDFLILESQKILEKSRNVLIQAGFDPDMISTALEKKCHDPAGTLLKLADSEGVDTLAVGRWGKASISKQLMGSVTYKLAKLAHNRTCWVIDPRVRSQDVLVGLVDAPVSTRALDYTVRYFSHLKKSKFTLFHVIPPVPALYWESHTIMDTIDPDEQLKLGLTIKEHTDRIKQIAYDAKEKLVQAGVPAQNVSIKIKPQKIGIARDILWEFKSNDYGILVIGRKGSKDIKEFSLGSKSNKLLLTGQALMICVVS